MNLGRITELLGNEAALLLSPAYRCFPLEGLLLPGVDFVERAWLDSSRPPRTLAALQRLFDQGRLAGTGYLSFLAPACAAGLSVGAVGAGDLAVEGGCSGLIAKLPVVEHLSRRYAHRLPLIAKLAPRDTGGVRHAHELGAAAVAVWARAGAEWTVAELGLLAEAVAEAHALGLGTIVGCEAAMRGGAVGDRLYSVELAAKSGADLVLPLDDSARSSAAHSIDTARGALAASGFGRAGLLNADAQPASVNRIAQGLHHAVINKRAGGIGFVAKGEAFEGTREENVAYLHAIQDVYRCGEITVA